MSRRFCEWRINWREHDYEVIRYENGQVVLVGIVNTRDEAWCAYELDRAIVLADPLAIECRSVEQRLT